MVVKLYISGISGNKEVKTKQQRVQMILDSKQISYEAIDITEPGKEKDKEFMQQNGKVRERLGKHPLPPQIFNDDHFCGDYEDFDLANEVDELEKFLHIESKDLENGSKVNGIGEMVTEPSKPDEENPGSGEDHKVNGLDGDAVSEPPPSEVVDEAEKILSDESNPPQTNELDDEHGTEEEVNAAEDVKQSNNDDGNETKEDEEQAEEKTAEEEETNDAVDDEKEQEE